MADARGIVILLGHGNTISLFSTSPTDSCRTNYPTWAKSTGRRRNRRPLTFSACSLLGTIMLHVLRQ